MCIVDIPKGSGWKSNKIRNLLLSKSSRAQIISINLLFSKSSKESANRLRGPCAWGGYFTRLFFTPLKVLIERKEEIFDGFYEFFIFGRSYLLKKVFSFLWKLSGRRKKKEKWRFLSGFSLFCQFSMQIKWRFFHSTIQKCKNSDCTFPI